MNDNDTYQWARSAHGPVCNRDEHVTCYGCGSDMVFVSKHVRLCNGTPYNVRAHYRHKTTNVCSKESVDHIVAKELVKKYLDRFKLYKECKCGARIPIIITGDADVEVSWGAFRLDVGVRTKGEVTGAVEILKTHDVGDEKAKALSDGGLAWVEVYAEDVLKCVETKNVNLCVFRCANMTCEGCMNAIRKRKIRSAREKVEAEWREHMQDVMTREDVVNEARAKYVKLRDAKTNNDEVWSKLSEFVYKSVSDYAQEIGLTQERMSDVKEHTEQLLNGAHVLTCGKYKGCTIDHVESVDRSYLVWLAGYSIGDQGVYKASTQSSKFMSREMCEYAKQCLDGTCYACGDEIPDWETYKWKNLCGRCYYKYRQ